MKKFLNIFFVTLGVIFFALILISGFLFLSNYLDAKKTPLLSETEQIESVGEGESDVAPISDDEPVGDNTDKHPLLNESQEAVLETFGIDPADVPNEITPEQEACFVEALGAERVEEIKAGELPNAIDFFKAGGCI